MTKKHSSFVKKIFGAMLAVFILPFYLLLWIFQGILTGLQDFCEFFQDFFRSMTDPDYIPPIGLRGFYALKGCRQAAFQAEAEGDYEKAALLWKKCALLYDTDAMIRVGKNIIAEADSCESEQDDREVCQRAAEWYAVAASFGNSAAESEYEHITGHKISADEKAWFRRNFKKSSLPAGNPEK